MTYGVFAGVEPDVREIMEDGFVYQFYVDVTEEDYYAYGTALGEAGYSILEASNEEGIMIITLAFDGIQFAMTYDPLQEVMLFTLPEGADPDAAIGD